jgi:hypothetical protein
MEEEESENMKRKERRKEKTVRSRGCEKGCVLRSWLTEKCKNNETVKQGIGFSQLE